MPDTTVEPAVHASTTEGAIADSIVVTLDPITLLPKVIFSGPTATAQVGSIDYGDIFNKISGTPRIINYLDVPGDYDIFYKILIEEINKLYDHNHFISLAVMTRKLIENLIIDILRLQYGPREVHLYYDASIGRPNPLSKLLKTLEDKISDFKPISSSFDVSFIRRLEKCKKKGDAAAHSIDINVEKEWFDKNQREIAYSINLLMSILNKIR